MPKRPRLCDSDVRAIKKLRAEAMAHQYELQHTLHVCVDRLERSIEEFESAAHSIKSQLKTLLDQSNAIIEDIRGYRKRRIQIEEEEEATEPVVPSIEDEAAVENRSETAPPSSRRNNDMSNSRPLDFVTGE